MLRDMSFSFVKAVVGNRAYCSLIVDLTQMYSDCVKSVYTAKDRDFTTTNPLVNTTLGQSECAYYLTKCKNRISLSCDVMICCIVLPIHTIIIHLC